MPIAIENPSFENTDSTPGTAQGWSITTVATPYILPAFGLDREGFEGFNNGWHEPAADPGDGLYNEDALFALGALDAAFALFVGNSTNENFEDGWNNDAGLLSDFNAVTSSSAAYDTTPENFEDFEEGWKLPAAGGAPFNETSAFSYGAKAAGTVACIDKVRLVDGQTVTVDDGTNVPTVFELDLLGDGVTPGRVAVNLAPLSVNTGADVALVFAGAVNGVGAGLIVTASIDATNPSVAILTNDAQAASGNKPLAETVTDPDFVAAGMTGGANPVTTTEALFNGGPGGETFEVAWNNDGYLTTFAAANLRKGGYGTYTLMGSYDLNAGAFGTYTDGAAYTPPAFAGVLRAVVTTQLGSLTVVFGVSYVDGGGTARTAGAVTVPALSPVGTNLYVDEDVAAFGLGWRDLSNVSEAVALEAGVVEFRGYEKTIEDFESSWTSVLT